MFLTLISLAIVQILFDTDYERAYKIYQVLIHLLYLPALILILYSFKSIVKIRNKLFVKNIVAFILFGILLFWIGKTGIIEYNTLLFFSAPIFLYAFNRVVLKKFLRGYQLLNFLFHYVVLFVSFFILTVVMIYTITGNRFSYVKDMYIENVYISNDAEIYVSNPALILLVAMVLFISANRIKRPPKERIVLFLFVGILYSLLYYGFVQYINYM